MGILSSLTSKGLDEQKDIVAGGKKIFDSGVYDATIKVAYMITSKSGALGVTFEFDINGSSYSETVYITNREKKNYYITKSNTKAGLPGFNLVNNICFLTLDKELSVLEPEKKVLNIFDFETKTNKPTEVPVLMELLGKKLKLAISNTKTNKRVKDGSGNYVASDTIINVNKIEHVFNTNGYTKLELDKKVDPTFLEDWLDKYKGVEVDKTTKAANTSLAKSPANNGSSEDLNQLFV